jgi:hypothetical protein
MAWALAARWFPDTLLTEYELVALEGAVRTGIMVHDSYSRLLRGQPHWETGLTLDPADAAILRALVRRRKTGEPAPPDAPKLRRPTPKRPPPAQYGSGLPGDPSVIGQLPEPFSRRGPRRSRGGSYSQSPGWIELPIPDDQRKLIDLPGPDDLRPRRRPR